MGIIRLVHVGDASVTGFGKENLIKTLFITKARSEGKWRWRKYDVWKKKLHNKLFSTTSGVAYVNVGAKPVAIGNLRVHRFWKIYSAFLSYSLFGKKWHKIVANAWQRVAKDDDGKDAGFANKNGMVLGWSCCGWNMGQKRISILQKIVFITLGFIYRNTHNFTNTCGRLLHFTIH